MIKTGKDLKILKMAPIEQTERTYSAFYEFKERFMVQLLNDEYFFTFHSILAVWLDKHIAPLCEGRWVIDHTISHTILVVYFKNKGDAMQFKLTWG